jgi:L-lactate permease
VLVLFFKKGQKKSSKKNLPPKKPPKKKKKKKKNEKKKGGEVEMSKGKIIYSQLPYILHDYTITVTRDQLYKKK